LVNSNPRASVFHTPQWLEALKRTYNYVPLALTTSPDLGPLANGVAFCRVDSWLTGSRLVSVPFSDHCDPLLQHDQDLQAVLVKVREKAVGKYKYIEIRPRTVDLGPSSGFGSQGGFCFHALDLKPSLDAIHSGFHKDGVQRKIRRAEREHVELTQGRTEALIRQFYDLLVLTRRRHGVPPQPFAWFRNLADCMGDRLMVRVASVGDRPVASILTLRHMKTLVYKYGCSDARHHNLGGMYYLFWRAIQDAKSENLAELDLGRSEENNPGLIRFKDNLGAVRTPLTYWRSPAGSVPSGSLAPSRLSERILSHMPGSLLRLAGQILYRHIG
ncbi:MAG TPA: GNAT family N-acetyltransferase, partial [Terriglobia bacterium]|nr:GNAT family N-acetyltransferase [Terriglobia bacterium]